MEIYFLINLKSIPFVLVIQFSYIIFNNLKKTKTKNNKKTTTTTTKTRVFFKTYIL